jgi:TonB family protein
MLLKVLSLSLSVKRDCLQSLFSAAILTSLLAYAFMSKTLILRIRMRCDRQLFLIMCCLLTGSFCFGSGESSVSRSEHVQAFNMAQKCFNSTSKENPRRSVNCAKRALDAGRHLFDPDSINIANLIYNYGWALKLANNKQKAFEVLNDSLALYEAIYGKSSLAVLDVLIDMGEPSKARRIAKKHYETNSVEYASVLLKLSLSGMMSARATANCARSAHKIFLKEEGVASFNTATASFQIGKVKYNENKYKSAIPYLLGAIEHPSYAIYAHGWLVQAYGHTNQDDLASYHAEQLGRFREGKEENYVPVFIPTPKYPIKANRSGKEGYAIVELTISKQGHATDIVLIEERPNSYNFGVEAVKAAESLLYAPRFVDGEAQEVPGVLWKYNFKMLN